MNKSHVPLRPCGICSQPCPDGNCPKPGHAKRGAYRPERQSVRSGVYASAHYRRLRLEVIARAVTCVYCAGAPANSADHVVPHSRGGETSRRNMVGCCRTCNTSKGDRTLREWVATSAAPMAALELLAARIRQDLPV